MTTNRVRALSIALACGLLAATAWAQQPARMPAPDGASVYFISPSPDEHLRAPVIVRFGLRGMGVAPAGVDHPNTGHHHLLVDTGLPPVDLPIPNDAQHRHFGAGQTEIELDLPAGPHTLQLVLGDHRHIPHDPPITSDQISIVVEE